LDQLYSRTETPEAGDAAGAPQEEASGAAEGPVGILSGLPHRRAHRRSARRGRESAAVTAAGRAPATASAPAAPSAAAPAAPPVRGGASAAAAQAVAVDPAEERHLHAVADLQLAPVARRRRPRRKTLPPPREPAPGIAQLALDGAVATAKLPWRVAGELARQAAGSISGTLRR
jgi:hypothetical protein